MLRLASHYLLLGLQGYYGSSMLHLHVVKIAGRPGDILFRSGS